MKAVFHRELQALMRSAAGWLMLCAVPAAFAVMTTLHLISGSAADYIRVVVDATVAFALIAPVCAARGYCLDRASGADRLLHSLPVKPLGVALGKFLAYCVPFLAGVLLSCLYPVALGFFAQLSAVQIAGGMLIYALSGMTVIACALYVSRLTKSAALNAVCALLLLALCHFLPDIAVYLISWGVSYWLALICIALIALLFGWKMTKNLVSALVVAIVAEAAGLIVLSGTNGMAFWNGLCGIVNIQLHFNSLYIGVMELSDAVHFPLLIAFLISLCAQGWRMETFAKRRDA